ncbi:IPTL-CTERM protein sorting domain-containing protein [Halopseudomonas salegens]|uniref:IPTL-CTERM protein sorting domain-containing protein n=2 Tax=Halopseudomonas salegens TaxID=1434072 RepID=A0A1H2HY86_9GAMM|nr:IPTL-CTERM protein sorting domain-containing protein [Halopseudomonas salegens]
MDRCHSSLALSRLFCVIVVLLATFSGKALAQAVSYSYVGDTYTNADPPYTTADNLTGTFSTAAPIPPNFSGDATALVTSLSFDDSVAVRTLADSTLCRFDIATDATGTIIDWALLIRQSDTGPTENQHSIETYSGGLSIPDIDQAGFDFSTGNTDCSGIALGPFATTPAAASDAWTDTRADAGENIASIPTLSAWSLLAMSMIMLCIGGFFANRRSSASV